MLLPILNIINVSVEGKKYFNLNDIIFLQIRTSPDNKLILWFGSIQNLSLDTQPQMLALLSGSMQGRCH